MLNDRFSPPEIICCCDKYELFYVHLRCQPSNGTRFCTLSVTPVVAMAITMMITPSIAMMVSTWPKAMIWMITPTNTHTKRESPTCIWIVVHSISPGCRSGIVIVMIPGIIVVASSINNTAMICIRPGITRKITNINHIRS